VYTIETRGSRNILNTYVVAQSAFFSDCGRYGPNKYTML